MRILKNLKKKLILKRDYGTNELRHKIANEITTEPLDLCFKKNKITKKGYYNALRLKKLHYLRYGDLYLRGFDLSRARGLANEKNISDEIMQKNIRHYNKALRYLESIGASKIVFDTCIYRTIPIFLLYNSAEALGIQNKFVEGINILSKAFKQK